MGTIVPRKRKNGTTGYTAQIVIKRGGAIVHREAKTFDRNQAASAWIKRRETELAVPGAVERAKTSDVTLKKVIGRYLEEATKDFGKTKKQVLNTIMEHEFAEQLCEAIDSVKIVEFAQSLLADKQPQTVGNYMSHLAAVFAIARPAWDYPLSQQAMDDAQVVTKRLGVTSKSNQRDRRPTLAELDMYMEHFKDRSIRRPDSGPMVKLVAFGIYSTRRLEEITRIAWTDLDEKGNRVLVRDMKNPGDKVGNHIWCDLVDEAMQIIKTMDRTTKQIFPFNHKTISAAFTRAGPRLEVEDLHFHDLRHEGISRLFEMGWNIPHVAAVSGHRSCNSLKRYTHIRQSGDKYAGWKWITEITTCPNIPDPTIEHAE